MHVDDIKEMSCHTAELSKVRIYEIQLDIQTVINVKSHCKGTVSLPISISYLRALMYNNY